MLETTEFTLELAKDRTIELTRELTKQFNKAKKNYKKWVIGLGVIVISVASIAPIIAMSNKAVYTGTVVGQAPIVPEANLVIDTQEELDEFMGRTTIQKVEMLSHAFLDMHLTDGFVEFDEELIKQLGLNVVLFEKNNDVKVTYSFVKTVEETNTTRAEYELIIQGQVEEHGLVSVLESIYIESKDTKLILDSEKSSTDSKIALEWLILNNLKLETETLNSLLTDEFVEFTPEISNVIGVEGEFPTVYGSTHYYTLRMISNEPGTRSHYAFVFKTNHGKTFKYSEEISIFSADENPGLVNPNIEILNIEKDNFINTMLFDNTMFETQIELMPEVGMHYNEQSIFSNPYIKQNEEITLTYNVEHVTEESAFVVIDFQIEDSIISHQFEVYYSKSQYMNELLDEVDKINSMPHQVCVYAPWLDLMPDALYKLFAAGQSVTIDDLIENFEYTNEELSYKIIGVAQHSNATGSISLYVEISHNNLGTKHVGILKISGLKDDGQNRTNILIKMIQTSLIDNAAQTTLPEASEMLPSEVTEEMLNNYPRWENSFFTIKPNPNGYTVPGTTITWSILETNDEEGSILIKATVLYNGVEMKNNTIAFTLTGFNKL